MSEVKDVADVIKAQTVLLDVQPGQKMCVVLSNRTFPNPRQYSQLGELLKGMMPQNTEIIFCITFDGNVDMFKCVDEEKDLWQRLPSKTS